jgi:hypothetical protein
MLNPGKKFRDYRCARNEINNKKVVRTPLRQRRNFPSLCPTPFARAVDE